MVKFLLGLFVGLCVGMAYILFCPHSHFTSDKKSSFIYEIPHKYSIPRYLPPQILEDE